jgi:acyl-CoA oxidase
MTTDASIDDLAVDVAVLRRTLDGPWSQARDQVRATLRDPVFASRPGDPDRSSAEPGPSLDERRDRVFSQLQAIAQTDGPKFLFPKEYGGLDNLGAAMAGFETQAFGDLSLLIKCGVQFGLFGGAIRQLGTERHHARYLEDIMTVDLPGCFAMTETGHGSDVQSIRTTATYDADTGEFVVTTPDPSARKDYIGNAARHGRLAVVFVQLVTQGQPRGVHALLVPIRDDAGQAAPGVYIEDDGEKAGLGGVDNGRLGFDRVRVPREALLDRFGSVAVDGTYSSPIEHVGTRFFTMLGTLVQGRVSISGAAVSAGKTALTIAIRYGDSRRQFAAPGTDTEVPILDYLAHQRALLPALAKTYALSFAQAALVAELELVRTATEADESAHRRLETHAAGLKAASTWHASATIQTCREACGGAGYLAVNQLVGLRADTDVFTTFEGANTVLLQLVGKSLLTNYQAEFSDLDPVQTLRLVVESVAEVVLERTGARAVVERLVDAWPGSSEEGELLDRDHQLALLTWREKHIFEGLARRLRQAADSDLSPFEVVNNVQDHLLLAARAHIDARILEAFAAAVDDLDDTDDPTAKALLSRLCDLHALCVIEQDRAWFLEHNRFTPGRSKAITATVNELCRELRPHARALIDAFGIPDEVLVAPIAAGSGSS